MLESGWDVSQVTDMTNMFGYATSFNNGDSGNNEAHPLPWVVSNVTRMGFMFLGSAFNQDISHWDVGNVTDMFSMFDSDFYFNQDLHLWDVSKVENMGSMFRIAKAFNNGDPGNNGAHPLTWKMVSDITHLPAVTNMATMFTSAEKFNQNISSWNVSNVTAMNAMFYNATRFNNGDITNIHSKPLTSWDTHSLTGSLGQMFSDATAFNQDISTWNVAGVTNMFNMFYYDVVFNQDLHLWNVGNVTDMSSMFSGAIAFDRNLGDWNVSKVNHMEGMFASDTLSTDNYDDTLIGWYNLTQGGGPGLQGATSIPPFNSFNGGFSKYCRSETQRAYIMDTVGWNTAPSTFTDGGKDPDCDVEAPSVVITDPLDGATVSGTVIIHATATDNIGVTKVEFYYGTTLIDTCFTGTLCNSGSDYATTSPKWNTTLLFDGSYNLTAKAYDVNGNSATSSVVTVIIANGGGGGSGGGGQMCSIAITPAITLDTLSGALHDGAVNVAYNASLVTTVNTAGTVSFELVSGTPPPGLLPNTTGNSRSSVPIVATDPDGINGLPTTAGTYTGIVIRAVLTVDSTHIYYSNQETYSIKIDPGGGGSCPLSSAPSIAPSGSTSVTVIKGSTYTELGAVATDGKGNTFLIQPPTTDIFVKNATGTIIPSVDTNTLGTYTVTYTYTDSCGTPALPVTRTVTVVPPTGSNTPPLITPLPDSNGKINTSITKKVGTYADPGARATDLEDNLLGLPLTVNTVIRNSLGVVVSSIDTNILGRYTISYTVTDSGKTDTGVDTGNPLSATVTRTVTIIPAKESFTLFCPILPDGIVGTVYPTQYMTTASSRVGGTVSFSIISGALPNGLGSTITASGTRGEISVAPNNVPTKKGIYTFTVRARDAIIGLGDIFSNTATCSVTVLDDTVLQCQAPGPGPYTGEIAANQSILVRASINPSKFGDSFLNDIIDEAPKSWQTQIHFTDTTNTDTINRDVHLRVPGLIEVKTSGDGKYVYTITTGNTLEIYDASNPALYNSGSSLFAPPQPIGVVLLPGTYAANTTKNTPAVQPTDMTVIDNIIYVTSDNPQAELAIIDTTDKTKPVVMGTYDAVIRAGLSFDTFLTGSHVYADSRGNVLFTATDATNSNGALIMVDATAWWNPTVVQLLADTDFGSISGMAVFQEGTSGYAYMSGGSTPLFVVPFDFSNGGTIGAKTASVGTMYSTPAGPLHLYFSKINNTFELLKGSGPSLSIYAVNTTLSPANQLSFKSSYDFGYADPVSDITASEYQSKDRAYIAVPGNPRNDYYELDISNLLYPPALISRETIQGLQSVAYDPISHYTFGASLQNGRPSTLPPSVTVNLKFFVEGYYDPLLGGFMTPAALNENVVSATSTDVDAFTAEIRETTAPYALVGGIDLCQGMLHTDGSFSCSLPSTSDLIGKSYYIVVRHRHDVTVLPPLFPGYNNTSTNSHFGNALEIWSANPVLIAPVTSYDFSTSTAQAYGSNQILLGSGKAAMYTGDINQDEIIDSRDAALVTTDLGRTRYRSTDLNGDGTVDTADQTLVGSNAGITAMHP